MRIELYYVHIKQPDWRERALILLEPDVKRFSRDWKISGLEKDDIEQELRHQLWRKLPKYNPFKSSLRTWAWQVMRNRKIDLNRRANDFLDSEMRIFPETEAGDLDNKGHVGSD